MGPPGSKGAKAAVATCVLAALVISLAGLLVPWHELPGSLFFGVSGRECRVPAWVWGIGAFSSLALVCVLVHRLRDR